MMLSSSRLQKIGRNDKKLRVSITIQTANKRRAKSIPDNYFAHSYSNRQALPTRLKRPNPMDWILRYYCPTNNYCPRKPLSIASKRRVINKNKIRVADFLFFVYMQVIAKHEEQNRLLIKKLKQTPPTSALLPCSEKH